MTKVTHAGAVIFRKNDRQVEVLLTRRVGGKVPGFFFTQGHIEKGETPKEAAQREMAEETGIEGASFKGDLGILTRKGLAEDGQWYRKVIHFFLFQTAKNERSEWTTQSPDGKTFKLKFVPVQEANAYLFFEEEKNLLRSAAVIKHRGK